MATTQLGRIGGLTAQLDPLGGKQRGMRIEADEWNALVGVVAGLLRFERDQEESLHAELAGEFAPKAHHHVGDIAIDSLDTELQSRLASDGATISTRLALADLQARVEALAGDLTRAAAATEDVERSAKLRQLDDRFAGIADLRGLVTGLSAQVAGLKEGIDAVIELRGSLGGVDVANLRDRLTTLEALGEHLDGVDGTPVQLKDVELQIKELQDVLDVKPGSGLDDRINVLRDQLSADVDSRVDIGLSAAQETLQSDLAGAKTSITSDLDAKLEGARTDLADTLDAKLLDTRATLDASLSLRVATATDGLRASLVNEATQLVDGRFAEVPSLVQSAATTAVAAATPALTESVLGALGTTFDARFADASSQLQTQLDAVSGVISSQLEGLPSLVVAHIDELLPGFVDERVSAASDTLTTTLGARLDTQLASIRDALASTLQD
jgi:hypothetical protein